MSNVESLILWMEVKIWILLQLGHLDKNFIPRANKNGEIGSPCLSPFLAWNEGVGKPLT